MKSEPGKKPSPSAKKQSDRQYPQNDREYEKMMRHDAFRKVHGRTHQTKWADRS